MVRPSPLPASSSHRQQMISVYIDKTIVLFMVAWKRIVQSLINWSYNTNEELSVKCYQLYFSSPCAQWWVGGGQDSPFLSLLVIGQQDLSASTRYRNLC